MSSKVLLIGMAPGHGDPTKPLEGRIGKRLAQLANLTEQEYLDRTLRCNLVQKDVPRGKWPMSLASAEAIKIREERWKGCQKVILLGKLVAEAFWPKLKPDFLSAWEYGRGVWIWVFPHPSGLNRWWNDPANLNKAQRVLRNILS